MPTRFEIEGRANKAWKLARFARRAGYTFQDLAEFDDSQWELLAGMAGVQKKRKKKGEKDPSERTRGMAVGYLTPRPNEVLNQ